jgi:hypothetical protein
VRVVNAVLAWGPMRIACYLATVCAIVALVMVFVTGGPQGPRAMCDEGDHIGSSQPDFSDVLSALPPLILPPPRRDLVVIDHRTPISRLSSVEVFRPPQSRA